MKDAEVPGTSGRDIVDIVWPRREPQKRKTSDYFRDAQGRLWKWTKKRWRRMTRAAVCK